MPIETRALPGATIENVDEERHTVDARVLSYRQADTFGTVWDPGCLSDSLKAGNPVILAHHDVSRPIGKVLSHRDSSDGLELTIQMADLDSVPDARTAFSLMRDNVISGWSVGFQRNKWDPVPNDQRSAFGSNPAKEFMRSAFLKEVSCVAMPSVPGTATLAMRADEGTGLVVVTMEDIERQFEKDLLTREEARAMLADLRSEYRMRIVLGSAAPVIPIPTAEETGTPDDPAAAAAVPGEARDAGSPPMVPVAPASDDDDEDEDDVATLAASVDAALDSAVYWMSKSSPDDVAGLPDNIQQALALVGAAGVVADDLLLALGVEDPDDPGEMEGSDNNSGRADTASEVAADSSGATSEAREDFAAETVEVRALSTKPWDPKPADYTLPQWKAACLIWDGPDDQVGSGSLPVLEPNGDANKNGMAAAAGRLNQVDASPADKTAAAKKLLGLYASNKLKAPGSLLQAARSVEDPEVREIVLEAELESLDDIFARNKVA
jgi:HK97 family phage prohead protease